jgi:hypothetical protein
MYYGKIKSLIFSILPMVGLAAGFAKKIISILEVKSCYFLAEYFLCHMEISYRKPFPDEINLSNFFFFGSGSSGLGDEDEQRNSMPADEAGARPPIL